ncbi:MAG: FMN-binding protein [Candidatus Omnitrophica bacterium]|nr:FMN-binding protein [Candidatus Omnitrophota bacterium]
MKEKIRMVIVLVLTGALSAAFLSLVSAATAGRIAYNQEVKLKRSLLDVFGVSYTEATILDVFERNILSEPYKEMSIYKYVPQGSGGVQGVAFPVRGAGFWGPISGILALESDLVTIRGIKILEHSETPGLGGRIAEPEFQGRFSGKSVQGNFEIVAYAKAKDESQVDAITGATETSKALERILKNNIARFYELVEDKHITVK